MTGGGRRGVKEGGGMVSSRPPTVLPIRYSLSETPRPLRVRSPANGRSRSVRCELDDRWRCRSATALGYFMLAVPSFRPWQRTNLIQGPVRKEFCPHQNPYQTSSKGCWECHADSRPLEDFGKSETNSCWSASVYISIEKRGIAVGPPAVGSIMRTEPSRCDLRILVNGRAAGSLH